MHQADFSFVATIVFGTNILVYIKTGNGGNIFGYENKYVKIANRIYDVFGVNNTFDDIIYIGF